MAVTLNNDYASIPPPTTTSSPSPTITPSDLNLSGSSPATTDIPLPPRSPITLPSSPPELKYKESDVGLPPAPHSATRASTAPSKAKPNREAISNPDIWEKKLFPEFFAIMESKKNVRWSTIDLRRIGNKSKDTVTVMIGVVSGYLPGHSDATHVTSKCKEILAKNKITDVEVEIYEQAPGDSYPCVHTLHNGESKHARANTIA